MMLSETARTEIREAVKKYPRKRSAILPALHIAHHEHGYLCDEIYLEISEIIGTKCVYVAEAASFYTYFPKSKERGKYYIQVCRNISCALLGARHLADYLCEKLNIKLGETTKDKLFTVVEVECLGSCTTAPMMQINDDFHENLTQEKVDQIIADLSRKAQE